MLSIQKLPEQLQEIIGTAIWEKNLIGMSGAGVYKLTGIKGGGNAYLKMLKMPSVEPLHEEAEILRWLKNKLPVPKVILYDQDDEYEYILLSEVEGRNAKELPREIITPAELGRRLAKSLMEIHQIKISDCPFNARVSMKLEKATERVEKGLVDANDFDSIYQGKTAEQLLQLLKTNLPSNETLVLTHGDFSLANILFKNNVITGIVDWGRAGIGDRHQDLAIAIRSLKHYSTEEALHAFINTYGSETVDFEKVEYYILLDELF